jgi:serine/threonine-protein kinase RsbW/stage II sporulation protein AB (anti-sigma F factor)
VAEFATNAGLPATLEHDVRLCVSEALSNAVLHAFRDRPDGDLGTVSVSAEAGSGELVVLVGDDGMGFSRRDDSPGMGLGLPLLSALASSLEITASEQGGTLVRMTFLFKASSS